MKRIDKLKAMVNHPVNGKLFNKLAERELDEVVIFVKENEGLSNDDYMRKANRWYLDVPEKPKHLTDMWAIVTQCK